MFAEAGDGDGEVLLLLVVCSFLCFGGKHQETS